MFRYQSVVGLVALVLFLSGGTAVAGRVPEGLRDLLKAHRFNLYDSPAPANDMILTDLKGRALNLSALRGKVVILNFWRIDCPPCATEKPILERTYRRLAARGLEVVAVNLFDNPDRLRSYVGSHGFSFRFGFDPNNRLSLQRQALRPGLSTTFIVNGDSEAIYEVPGVPTTYVIDRSGAVIGNSVGMVDWERRPYTDLLEALLAERTFPAATDRSSRPQLLASSNYEDRFSDAAGHGTPPPPLGPTWKQAQFQGPVRQGTPSTGASSQPVLPFQGTPAEAPQTVTTPSAPVAPTAPIAPPPEAVNEGQPALRRRPARPQTRQAVKPPPPRAGSPTRRYPTQPPRPVTSPGGQPSAPGNIGQAVLPPQRGYTSALPSPSGAGTFGSGNLPPLPPALPYTPHGRLGRQQRGGTVSKPVVPDQNGNIMARIPSVSGRYPGEGPVSPGRGTPMELPAGRPVPANTIDRSILDTFENLQLSKPVAPQPILPPQRVEATANQQTPANSFLGQLGRDFSNLGAGIKRTFSGIWPGGQASDTSRQPRR